MDKQHSNILSTQRTNPSVKNLIEKGKSRGYITVEELNKALPSERETSENIEDIMASISDLGISLISESETDDFEAENEDLEQEDDIDESGNFDEKELSRSDDPVRMYLREMGAVELLSREGEIAIAKRIEAGNTVMLSGLCESPMTLKAIASWRDELVSGTMQLRDNGFFHPSRTRLFCLMVYKSIHLQVNPAKIYRPSCIHDKERNPRQ